MTSRTATRNWIEDMLDRFDALPKGARIAVMVLGFILFWPIGLAILAYLIWSGDMMCSGRRNKFRSNGWGRHGRGGWQSSGNVAFDEYREATLRQLEEDQREFSAFIDRLRRAKDQQEFDAFMADRMQRKQDENGAEKAPEDGERGSPNR